MHCKQIFIQLPVVGLAPESLTKGWGILCLPKNKCLK